MKRFALTLAIVLCLGQFGQAQVVTISQGSGKLVPSKVSCVSDGAGAITCPENAILGSDAVYRDIFASGMRVLADLPHAAVRTYLNEVSVDQKLTYEDPVKLRFGAWNTFAQGREYYAGALSWDILEGNQDDPTRREKGIEAYKVNAFGGGMRELFLQRPGTTDDNGMRRIYSADNNGWEFMVPIKAPNLVNVGIATPVNDIHSMWSPDGRYVTQQQDDGNFVTYRLAVPYDVGQATPCWSAWSGFTGQCR